MRIHFLEAIFIGVCVLGLLFWFRKRLVSIIRERLWISTVRFVVIYLIIISLVIYTEMKLKFRLESFDSNHDGIFSGKEITSEQTEALRKIAHDIGRTFAVFTGLFYAAFITFALFLLDIIKKYIRLKYIKWSKG